MKKVEKGRTLVSLQYLRAIAAMLVVYLHAAIQVNNLSAPAPSAFPEVGRCGVDIFFVLSGYVMWISTMDRPASVVDFLERRLIRIVPIYWVVTLAAAGVALFLPQILRSTKFEIHHLLASLFFVPWHNPVLDFDAAREITITMTPVITPGWTLNFEMFFYSLFALALFVPQKHRIAALALIILSVHFIMNGLSAYGDAARFYGSSLVFEFLAGTILAGVSARRPVLGARVATFILIGAFLLLLFDDAYLTHYPRALVLGVPAVLLVAAAIEIERAGRLRFIRLFDELGNASYSIYVTHIFVVAGLRIIPRFFGLDLLTLGGPFFIAASLILAASVGLAVHAWIERPLIAALNRRIRGGRELLSATR
jgi:exopolysaccharide production protein ExoZ